MPEGSLSTTTAGGIVVSASFGENVFPEGVGMQATDLSKEEAMDAAADAVEGEVVDAAGADITFYDADGNEVEPYEGGEVNVSLTLSTPLEDGELTVVHIDDAGNAEELSASDVDEATETGASFIATEFSPFVLASVAAFSATADSSEYVIKSVDTIFLKFRISFDLVLESPATTTYDGTAKKPIVENLVFGGRSCSAASYSYENNINAGEARVYFAIYHNGIYETPYSATFTIEPKSLSSADIFVEDCTYDGSAQEPEPTVECDGATLTKGTDYTVDYENNTNAGSATVTVTGKGNYTGTVEKSFTIEPADITLATVEVADCTYNNTAQEPEVTVTYAGKRLSADDYVVEYKNNTNAGKGTVVVKGKGNYKNTIRKDFTINQLDLSKCSVKLSQDSYYLADSDRRPDTTVTYGKGTLIKGTDYTVEYDNGNIGTATATIKAIGNNCTGSIEAKYRILAKGTIKAENIALDSDSFEYSGSARKPTVTITMNGETLIDGADYTVGYSNNVNSGTATVTVKGIINYNGEAKKSFTITPKSISGATVTLPSGKDYNYIYDGSAKKPSATVEVDGKKLKESVDYTVEYINNVHAGTATATITGKGNYTDTKTEEFTIGQTSLSGSVVALSQTTYTYDGTAKTPEVTVTYGGSKLTRGEDYTVSYENNMDAGTATVTITGKGNYGSNAITKNFTIEKASFSDCTLSVDQTDQTNFIYDGNAKEPGVTVTNSAGTKLIKDTDFTVDYSSNKKVGTATATVTGTGNYQGTKKANFTIMGADFAVTLGAYTYTYDGTEKKPTVTVMDNGTEVDEENYTVSFNSGDYIHAGDKTVTVTGKGSYSKAGTKTVHFTIASKSVSGLTVTLKKVEEDGSFNYIGKAITPAVTVTDGTTTLKSTDYTVAYSNNINAGKATDANAPTVTITGKGNYTGQVAKTFTINAVDLSECWLRLSQYAYTYDGEAKKPKVTVMNYSQTLTLDEGTDYAVTYSNNTNAGGEARDKMWPTVTVKAIGNNCIGSGSVSFVINKADISGGEIILSNNVFKKTGSEIKPYVSVLFHRERLWETESYTLTYSNNKEVGTATVTVTGIKNFTGTKTAEYYIIGSDFAVTLNRYTYTYDGTKKEPTVTVKDNGKELTKGTDYEVTYSEDRTNAGTATVYVKGIGLYNGVGTKTVNFTIGGRSISDTNIELNGNSLIYDGEAKRPDVTVTDNMIIDYKKDAKVLYLGTDYTVTYSNNTDAGTATVTVTGIGNYTGSASRNFTIAQKSIAGANISLSNNIIYNGTEQTPTIDAVTVDGQSLIRDKDYTPVYSRNIDAGTAVVTIRGKGNYAGVAEKTFTIEKAELDSDNKCVLSLIKETTYDGTEKELDVTVSYDGRKLTQNKDYTVKYSNNTNAGTATVTVTGKGNYSGTKPANFTIKPADISDSQVELSQYTYPYQENVKNQPQVKKVTYNGMPLTSGTDYTYDDESYNNNVNAGTATVTIAGKGNYTGTKVEEFAISASDLNDVSVVLTDESGIEVNKNTYTYDGHSKRPSVVIMSGSQPVGKEGTDYTVTYSNNVNAGMATVTIKGEGNYTGIGILPFTINPYSIAGKEITLSDEEYTYDGTPKKPTVTIKDDGMENFKYAITEGTDYTVTYKNNIDVGTAGNDKAPIVTVTGKGNYAGTTKEAEFTIKPADISDCQVSLGQYNYTYDGTEKEPAVTVKNSEGTELNEGEDNEYTVTYSNNVNAGTATVTITGKKDYSGTKTETFVINKVELKGASIGLFADTAKETSVTDSTYTYDGEAKKPEVTVTYDGKPLPESDYKITIENNTNAGTGTVVVTGTGANCTGTATKTFKINPAELAGHNLLLLGSYTEDLDIGYAIFGSLMEEMGIITEEELAEYISLDNASYHFTYDGTEKKPDTTVFFFDDFTKYQEKEKLARDVDYTVKYSDNVNITDNAWVTITGTGNYTGTAETTFHIEGKDFVATTTMSLSKDTFTYNGEERKPAVTVRDEDGTALKRNTDFKVAYINDVNAGTATAVVTPANDNYKSGGDMLTYTINPLDLSDSTVQMSLEKEKYKRDYTEKEPFVTVICDGDKEIESDNYTVTYKDNINGPTATAIVTGVSPNCTGTQELPFTIYADDDVFYADITVSPDTYTYDGTAKEPTVTVTLNGKELKEGEDYSISYSDNVDVGTATVTVTGKGDIKGEKTATFAITEKESPEDSGSSDNSSDSSSDESPSSSPSSSSGGSSVSSTTTKRSSSSSGSSTDDAYTAGSKGSKANYDTTGKKSVHYDICLVSDKKKTAKVPAKVKIGKKTYKVTAVSSYAFAACDNLESVTIGKNVKKIGKSAFSGCTKLKTIRIKSRMLTAKGVKNCLKDSSVETIIVPDGTEKTYAKLFAKENSGRGKAVKIITASQAAKKK